MVDEMKPMSTGKNKNKYIKDCLHVTTFFSRLFLLLRFRIAIQISLEILWVQFTIW